MIQIPFFKQQTNFTCGPAILRSIFSFYGKDFTEEELTKRLNTAKETGTENEMLVKVAREEGFYVYVNNDSSVDEIFSFIRRKIPVTVNIIELDDSDGHYILIKDVREDKIIYNDPEKGESIEIDKEEFVKCWHSKYEDYNNRIMVITRAIL